MKTFLVFVLGYSRKTLIMILVLGAASGLASAGLIALVSKLFVQARILTRFELLQGTALLAFVAILALSLEVCARFILTKNAARRHRDLHINFSHMVLNESLRKLERTGLARLITIYTDDMSIIGGALISISSVGTGIFVIIGCVGYMVWISPGIMLACTALAIPSILVYRKLHRKTVSLARASFKERDAHVTHFKNIVNGIKELQLNFKKRENYVLQEYLPAVNAHERVFVRSHLASLLGIAWMQLMYFGLMIAALTYVILREGNPEVLGPFLVVALFMRGYLNGLLTAIPVWARAGAVLERLQDEGFAGLAKTITLEQPNFRFADASKSLRIETNKLEYRYISEENDKPFTVGPLNLVFNGGELVFVVGHNGAGKTTFAKLFSGLYESEFGHIVCNGHRINEGNRDSYRELFSAIFTDPFVFEALTVSDSEQLPDADLTSRIGEYLERLQLSYKVSVSGQRLSTVDLSYGQKKRLALLAAYLEDKSVLIFDEWAENQDPKFKEVFYNELLPELRDMGKLVIVISHESQYFKVADRILTLRAENAKTSVLVDGVDKPLSAL